MILTEMQGSPSWKKLKKNTEDITTIIETLEDKLIKRLQAMAPNGFNIKPNDAALKSKEQICSDA